ncbi:uncharacterized protein LOC111903925 [Lactuca sativa]|uniref:Uncharacterized protein n=1 Tax=Lactuca sativa TaxID=4236 RepID=A0A9R1X5L7_LACSA|nr:uncharacterized protein LOC111903925 [Lactuca sativa]KAJ0199464.1 hypothetical protein LSAT_V11C600333030 [Lactuca sativa]
MYFLVYYLVIHLCVSMHACDSRHLGVFHKEPGKELHLITSKTPEIRAGNEGRNCNETNMEDKESKHEFPSEELKMHKGNDIELKVSQDGTKPQGWKNHARLTMESKQKDSKEKINNSKDSSVTEDVGVMDYAQPHRKPPIHNLQP